MPHPIEDFVAEHKERLAVRIVCSQLGAAIGTLYDLGFTTDQITELTHLISQKIAVAMCDAAVHADMRSVLDRVNNATKPSDAPES